MDRKVATLSGGERRRIALARVLIEEPDLLFLDEPTNHLDLEMVQWLEKHLAAARTTLLMVTHDRYFLENVCGTLFELDGGRLHKYQGNYAYFLEKRAERIDNAHAVRDRARSVLRRELEWMRATPSARTGKSKSRIDRFYEIREEARKRLEDDPLHLHLNPERLGGKVIELHKVRLAYGERVLIDGLTHAFKRGERIGIVGANGAGKSSLLDLIVGKSEPTGGKVVIGETVVFGHFHQHGAQFPEEMRVLEAVRSIAEFMPLQKGAKLLAADLLERFLFPRHTHHNYVRVLSGGEKKRLHLLQVLMRNPNVLILDEPTNDLDIPTLNALEDFLSELDICLLVVSHDRFFMDKICTKLLVFEGEGKIKEWVGSYTELREMQKARAAMANTKSDKPARSVAQEPAVRATAPAPKKKMSFGEKNELKKLDAEVPALEKKKEDLVARIAANGSDHHAVMKLSLELEQTVKELEKKGERWLELMEKAEQTA
jgi:ATP-binding cassette subfamily F protein uup